MFILDEENGNSFSITREALNAITDHRLRMPKPRDVQAYTLQDGKKIPNITICESLTHVHKECFMQMIEKLRQEMVGNFEKYRDANSKITELKCGPVAIRRAVHIGFWKMLVTLTSKNPNFTVEDLSRMEVKDAESFEIKIISAEIKPRRDETPVVPATISKAMLERNNTRP